MHRDAAAHSSAKALTPALLVRSHVSSAVDPILATCFLLRHVYRLLPTEAFHRRVLQFYASHSHLGSRASQWLQDLLPDSLAPLAKPWKAAGSQPVRLAAVARSCDHDLCFDWSYTLLLDALALAILTFWLVGHLSHAWRNQKSPFARSPATSTSSEAWKVGSWKWWQAQTVLITGGSGGLGSELSKQLLKQGAKVICLDRNAPSEELLSHERFTFQKIDLLDRAALQSLAEKTHFEPTMLINNAGMHSGRGHQIDAQDGQGSMEAIDRLLDLNLRTHFWTIRQYLPGMKRRGAGHIVTISSIMGYVGMAGMTDYVATKHALVGLHSSLRQELDSARPTSYRNIRTTLVIPGRIRTPLFDDMHYPPIAEFLAPTLEASHLARRIVEQALAKHESCEIHEPFYARFTPMLRLLPTFVQDAAHWLTDANHAMD